MAGPASGSGPRNEFGAFKQGYGKVSTSRLKNTEEMATKGARYLSPQQLAERWNCSRTSAQRIADRAGMSKYFLGEGRNGMLRYALDEIEKYEVSRRIAVAHHGRA
jgi:hypothetical protein